MIRIATERDVPAMLVIYAPYVENTTYSFEYEVPSQAEFARRLQSYTRQFPWLVWEEDGQILGYAYGSAPFERMAYGWCAESSVYLRPDARGRGIGRKLMAVLEEFLRRQGYCLNYALVTSENTASCRFHERLGYILRTDFARCGYKMGRWLGVYWYEKQLNFVESPSALPAPWSAVGIDVQKLNDILDTLSLF